MSSAKANILNRLRSATTPSSTTKSDTQSISTSWKPPGYDQPERFARFKEALQASHAEIIETSEDEWPKQLMEIAASKCIAQWLYNPSSESGLRLEQQVVATTQCNIQLIPYDQPVESFKTELFNQIDASFTDVEAGIAETGTLVLLPDQDEPRLMSLVPPIHIALFRESTLLNSFSELIAQQQWSTQGMPTNALLISGPSKTADIQQTLAYGAHGPKELIVLVIRDIQT
ncbi:LutC/YkgG family protein [Alkalimarinus sediminis]|uniref:Lactate utilization protein n=1 Tax=Alkalimarinus sediminis TaxID=1632866 RepID=A0A9E8HIX4_9ALTE|nr:lactate utilization protein [Alkalimarinus sediminis]UZW74187.1 lactate utilization protein [Alkalimarinus sediminis]